MLQMILQDLSSVTLLMNGPLIKVICSAENIGNSDHHQWETREFDVTDLLN